MMPFPATTPPLSNQQPAAMGEPSAPVALVVSVMMLLHRDGRHWRQWPPVLSSSDAGTHSITGGLRGREQRNQLRTNKTGAGDREEDFLTNCHDIFKMVNIYLRGLKSQYLFFAS